MPGSRSASSRAASCPFDRILDEVASGRADAGLVIHEGQLTYEADGLHKVLDLGEWWQLETGLPLPLGVNAARRDIGERLPELSAVLLDSIQAGLANRREAMRYAMRFGRGIDPATADRFVGMYVNELTCDYGDEGRRRSTSCSAEARRSVRSRSPFGSTTFSRWRWSCARLRAVRAPVPHGAEAYICSYECTFCAGCTTELVGRPTAAVSSSAAAPRP